MRNAHRYITLAALAAIAVTVAPSALADDRGHLRLPMPPSPREVLRNFPTPPLPGVDFRGGHDRRGERGRWEGRDNGRPDGRYRKEGSWGRGGGRYGDRRVYDRGRWNDRNRYRDDRYRPYYDNRYRYRSNRGHGGMVWVDGYWVVPPFPGAVWIEGYYDDWGEWVPGYWAESW